MRLEESETRFAVLLFTDIVGSTDLKARHGVPAYSVALRVHNDHFERLTRECRGLRILQNMGDGYFAEVNSVTEAVRFALLFQDAMRTGPWGDIRLATRVGIHAGEVRALVAEGGSGILAPAADLAARVMSLAVGGQILLTRFPFDEARHFLREHPAVAVGERPPLRWLAHGPYLLKGRDEPIEIFEVGAEGLAPLTPPPDGEKAKRAIRPGEEETLGWRPAIGLEIPGRPGWRLIERLGTGGFGEVWMGEHAKLRQRRAFKFCFDDERLRALKREVTLVRLLRTALGDRDDIVRLHELKLDEPPFYLESDLAPHGSLLQWAEKQGGLAAIPLVQRIALVADTATALAAAHSIGVLHKDLKPTNILIFDGPDGTPRPRLVDFGIGTLADPDVLGQYGITAAGFTRATIKHSTGTPTYSPPEYLQGKPYTVQGDIYGLGVLLYQLVVADGTRPVASGWERDIADPLLLEDITACVDGDPARRLPSAAELADRLRHLHQRRAEIAEKERLARDAAARVEAEARELAERGRRQEIERHNLELRTLLAAAARSDRLFAEEKLRVGQGTAALAYLARACEYDPPSKLAAEKAIAALTFCQHLEEAEILTGHEGVVWSAQFSPDGTRIVTTSADQTARLWDAATGKFLAILSETSEDMEWCWQFSPDGTRLIAASDDNTARLWDAVTGKLLRTFAGDAQFSPDRMRILATSTTNTARLWDAVTGKLLATGHSALWHGQFSPDRTRILATSTNNTAELWDVATGKTLATLAGHKDVVSSAQFSPDGTRIVTASADQTARLWDATTGKALVTLAGHKGAVGSAQFSPDGARIVTTSADKTARLWDAVTGKLIAILAGHEDALWSAQFSPDGARIVTTSADKTARLWDAVTGKLIAILAGHEDALWSAQFSSDGTRIVTRSDDKTVRLWNAATGKFLRTSAEHWGWVGAQLSPDGTRIVTGSNDKTARLWDAATGKALATLAGHKDKVLDAQFSPDGTRIVTASEDKTARLWDAATGKALLTLAGHKGAVGSAQFSPDGARIVTTSADKTARLWDAATGKALAILTGHKGTVWSVQFSPDGTRIVTRSKDETVRLWDAATGKLIAILAGHDDTLWSVQFSPDGTRIVTRSKDETVRLWDAATGKLIATLTGHEDGIVSAEFSPDGARIVTASHDNTARLWRVATGKLLAALAGHQDGLYSAQFSPDGTRIVTTSSDRTLRLWDSATGKPLAILLGVEGIAIDAQFSPDGTRLVTASGDNTARVWTLFSPHAGPAPEWFPDFLRYMAQMRLNSDGELETLKSPDRLALRKRLRAVLRANASADTPYLRILRKNAREESWEMYAPPPPVTIAKRSKDNS